MEVMHHSFKPLNLAHKNANPTWVRERRLPRLYCSVHSDEHLFLAALPCYRYIRGTKALGNNMQAASARKKPLRNISFAKADCESNK